LLSLSLVLVESCLCRCLCLVFILSLASFVPSFPTPSILLILTLTLTRGSITSLFWLDSKTLFEYGVVANTVLSMEVQQDVKVKISTKNFTSTTKEVGKLRSLALKKKDLRVTLEEILYICHVSSASFIVFLC
jgi:hypothetical protein